MSDADLVAEFLAHGGQVTRCPDGVGLGEPLPRAKVLVGNAIRQSRQRSENCLLLLTALGGSAAPLSMREILRATGLRQTQVQRLLEYLVPRGSVMKLARPGAANRYALGASNDGMGSTAGGQASGSAAGAHAAFSSTPAARPGRVVA